MARFTPEQVRYRQSVVAIAAGLVVLLIVGSVAVWLFGAPPKQAGGLAEQPVGPETVNVEDLTEVRVADDATLTIPAVAPDAAAHANMVGELTLAGDESLGIDVSAHQQEIDWEGVASDGYQFAIIKATEGSGYTDPQFLENWQGAQDAGLVVGAYHYFTLCSPGADQAADFLATVPVDDAFLPPALDLEFDGACDARPDGDSVQAEIDAWVNLVEAAWGRRVTIYSSNEWREHYGLPVADGRADWLYDDLGRPENPEWAIWQMRFDGTVTGIDGPVDIDTARVEEIRSHSAMTDEEREYLQMFLDSRSS